MNGMSRTAAALSPQTRTLVVSTSMAATNRVGQQLKRACWDHRNFMAVFRYFSLVEHARSEMLRQDRPENGGGQHQDEHRIEHCAIQHALTGPGGVS